MIMKPHKNCLINRLCFGMTDMPRVTYSVSILSCTWNIVKVIFHIFVSLKKSTIFSYH